MNDNTIITPEYKSWLTELKSKIQTARLKASLAVNSALIQFYRDLGQMITEKQKVTQWGDKLLEQLSKDLQTEFPDMKGFSVRNLKYCRYFYQFYETVFGQQAVAQIVENGKTRLNQRAVEMLISEKQRQSGDYQWLRKQQFDWTQVSAVVI